MQKNSKTVEEKNTELSNKLINSAFKFALTTAGAFVSLHYNSRAMAHNQELYRQELNLQRATQATARRLISLENMVQEVLGSQKNHPQEIYLDLKNTILQLEQEIINNSTSNSGYTQHWLERTNQLLTQLESKSILYITNHPKP